MRFEFLNSNGSVGEETDVVVDGLRVDQIGFGVGKCRCWARVGSI